MIVVTRSAQLIARIGYSRTCICCWRVWGLCSTCAWASIVYLSIVGANCLCLSLIHIELALLGLFLGVLMLVAATAILLRNALGHASGHLGCIQVTFLYWWVLQLLLRLHTSCVLCHVSLAWTLWGGFKLVILIPMLDLFFEVEVLCEGVIAVRGRLGWLLLIGLRGGWCCHLLVHFLGGLLD